MGEIKKYIGKDAFLVLSSKPELFDYEGLSHVELGVQEYKLLSYFIDHVNTPVYLEDLAQHIWGVNYSADKKDPNSLKSQISRLRKKMNQLNDGLGNCIDTNFGLGSYTLVVRDEPKGIRRENSRQGSNATPFGNSTKEVSTAHYQDLLNMGYTPLSIAEALVANDKKLYGYRFQGSGIDPQNEGDPSQWAEYICGFPEAFQYLVNSEGAIVGDFSFVSITKAQEEAYLRGQYFEELFSPAETRDLFSAGKEHIMFLLNMSVNDEYSTPRNNSKIRKMFLEEILSLAEEGVLFSKIVTNVFKPSQESFYKQWGFRFVESHPLSGRVYELQMRPYPEKLYKHLMETPDYTEVNERLKAYYEK